MLRPILRNHPFVDYLLRKWFKGHCVPLFSLTLLFTLDKQTLMEVQYYLNILWRRKWIILLAMILSAVIAYVFVQFKSSVYKSNSIISTGVIDYTGISTKNKNAYMQQLQIEMRFDNLLEFMTSRQCINLLSFALVHHDLEALESGEKTFKAKEEINFSGIDENNLSYLSDLLVELMANKTPTFENPEDELYFNKVAKILGYDLYVIKTGHLSITRVGSTDYLNVEYQSNDPDLSYFGANTYIHSFINYFESIRAGIDAGTVSYLQEQVDTRKKDLDDKLDALKNYRSKGGIVDLESQKKASVNQMQRLEKEKEIERSSILANKKTIIELESMIKEEGLGEDDEDLSVDEEDAKRAALNRAILNLKKQVNTYERQFVDEGGDKEEIKSRISLTNKALDERLTELARLDKKEPLAPKERKDRTMSNNLRDRKIQSQIDLTNSEEKLKLIEENLGQLQSRIQSYVTNESYLSNLKGEIALSNDTYRNLVMELNKEEIANLKGESPLTIIEHPHRPEEAEADQQKLIAIFAGLVGAIIATFLIFLATFLDTSLTSPTQFKSFTQLPLLGYLNRINNKQLDLNQLFSSQTNSDKLEKFKEMVRDLRFKVEREDGHKVYMITSPRKNDGKSFLIANLAHSLEIKGKRTLIIDTNFQQNTLSQWSVKHESPNPAILTLLVENRLIQHFALSTLQTPYGNRAIDVIKNAGAEYSLMEGISSANFPSFLDACKKQYDYVFIEGAAMNNYSDTKELLEFADRVIAVFNADSSLEAADKNSVEFLQSLNGQYMGSILNKINLNHIH